MTLRTAGVILLAVLIVAVGAVAVAVILTDTDTAEPTAELVPLSQRLEQPCSELEYWHSARDDLTRIDPKATLVTAGSAAMQTAAGTFEDGGGAYVDGARRLAETHDMTLGEARIAEALAEESLRIHYFTAELIVAQIGDFAAVATEAHVAAHNAAVEWADRATLMLDVLCDPANAQQRLDR